jgi:hypothetical protein
MLPNFNGNPLFFKSVGLGEHVRHCSAPFMQ